MNDREFFFASGPHTGGSRKTPFGINAKDALRAQESASDAFCELMRGKGQEKAQNAARGVTRKDRNRFFC